MFARRKRPLEDEPLVPHGLIWQATDEPDTAVENAAVGPARQTADPAIELPIRQASSQGIAQGTGERGDARKQNEIPDSSSAPNRLGAISPPIPWPSPKTASVVRRPPISYADLPSEPAEQPANTRQDESRTYVNPENEAAARGAILGALQKKLSVKRHAPPEPKVEVIELGAEEKPPSRSAEAFRAVALTVRRSLSSSSTVIKVSLSQLREQLLAGVQTGNQRVKVWWASASPRLSDKLATARQVSTRAAVAARMNAGFFLRKARNHRVRIRIAAPAGVLRLVARSEAAWVAGRENIRREPRLWGSMAMAALSAALAVIVISGVSHYAPGADASRKLSTVSSEQNSVVHAAPVSRQIKRAGATRNQRIAEEQNGTLSKPSALAAKAAATNSSTPRRVRHVSEDDDYVAPDTYRYYGAGGSR